MDSRTSRSCKIQSTSEGCGFDTGQLDIRSRRGTGRSVGHILLCIRRRSGYPGVLDRIGLHSWHTFEFSLNLLQQALILPHVLVVPS